MTNKPVGHIPYIYNRPQRALVYVDKLRKTGIAYFRKLELHQFILFFALIMTTMTNQYNTSLHHWYLSYNHLSAQKSETALYRTFKNVFQPLIFLGRLWNTIELSKF